MKTSRERILEQALRAKCPEGTYFGSHVFTPKQAYHNAIETAFAEIKDVYFGDTYLDVDEAFCIPVSEDVEVLTRCYDMACESLCPETFDSFVRVYNDLIVVRKLSITRITK